MVYFGIPSESVATDPPPRRRTARGHPSPFHSWTLENLNEETRLDRLGTGAYAVRVRFPANYAIPAHSHPTDENVVISAGSVTLGMGDVLSKSAKENKTLNVGGYALMPAGMNHYAFAGSKGADIVLFGQGPVEFKYVNPQDDPRNAKTASK